MIEGQDDTHFRLYRESNPALKTNTWWSIAGTIDEVRTVADRLEQDTTQHSKRLRERISAAIPRFEASEEVNAFNPGILIFVRAHKPLRNENVGTIALHERLRFPGQNQVSRSMKAVLVVRR